ncbi:DUF928 domain-containing protein [Oscillatoria sp. CS-180]|uniref:DUF928 domain-containing protein n=1 Tax=Oscillatoria sp. CS-180 TaxID=3021720 RepID=UPI002330A37B|nr:DUF928 domain-containing protein [Oscillatoria sp. CS-180]MDB9527461.1 DUF928 domain-containing protein [Oscillatoria sp. CS-180]
MTLKKSDKRFYFSRLKRQVSRLGSGTILLLILGTPSLANSSVSQATRYSGTSLSSAVKSRAYEPPPGSQISGSGTQGGTRGCGGEMIAIAPQFSGTGQSFSSRPTFVWYMNPEPVGTLEFYLSSQADGESTLIVSEEVETQAGYIAYTLPDGEDLTVGETYTWQAILYCDDDKTMPGKWISADITIADPPADAVQAVSGDDLTLQDAIAYAAAGYWYDALAIVYNADSLEEEQFRQDMLLDLADLEAESDNIVAARRSDRLRNLAETP